MSRDRTELVRFLGDMYSGEQQSIAQLISAPDLAGDKRFSNDLRQHYVETEQHLRLILERLDSHEASVSAMKTMMKAAGKGLLLFALSQPETPENWRSILIPMKLWNGRVTKYSLVLRS